MKIGVAQINSTVGDFPKNAKKMLASYRECLEQGAEIVVFPELSLVGYPPQDLLFRSQFIEKCLQALDYLASEMSQVPALIGFVDRNHSEVPGKPFRNGVALVHSGQVQEKFFKRLLPEYDVFNEQRYFEPSLEKNLFEWEGKKIGVTICEDIWTEDYLPSSLYESDPVSELVEAGVDVVMNLSASPFSVGKPSSRQSMLQNVAKKHEVPIVYCNAVGANDQLVFDGHSFVVGSCGEVIGKINGFEESCQTFDLYDKEFAPCCSKDEMINESHSNYLDDKHIYQALVLGVRDYVRKCGFKSVCLGLSGGIDSALTAAIAAEAIGGENVYGLTMPSEYSSEGSINDSFALAKNLGIHCQEVPIGAAFDAIKDSLSPVFKGKEEDVTEENIQARIRGVFNMAYANKMGHLLLTTGNKSEMAVGYCTIYGDMCGGLGVISDVPKMRVYSVSRWINCEVEVIPWNTIQKPPSAELRPDQKDQDTLPDYDKLDTILGLYVEMQLSAEDIIENYGFDETLVRWVQRRVELNEWKRQQAAPGLKVTSKAFGVGRKMPIVHKFWG